MATPYILVVDDDDLNLEVLQAYLESEAYHVRTAFSGERALQSVKKHPPDLIMLDVRMNGISGYETCAILKNDDNTKHIPILMVTGFNADSDIQQVVAAGADDILFKPIRTPLMLMRVRRLLYQKQLYDQLYG